MLCPSWFSLEIRRTGVEDLLSIEEAARRLGGISKWTVHGWLSKGKLKRTKVGRRTMIRESELQRVIRDGGRSAPPPRKSNPRLCDSSSGRIALRPKKGDRL
jgi:excisionase family DNA binding protein